MIARSGEAAAILASGGTREADSSAADGARKTALAPAGPLLARPGSRHRRSLADFLGKAPKIAYTGFSPPRGYKTLSGLLAALRRPIWGLYEAIVI
jgi:hypothetical protein